MSSLIVEVCEIKEGCVIKPILETNHPCIGRMILKSINPEYLARKTGQSITNAT